MAAPLSGQIIVSGTAQQITTSNPQTWTIKAPKGNSNPVFIGPSGVTTSNGHQLDPGEVFVYERRSSQSGPTYQVSLPEIYVVGTASDKVTWFGSP